jgi:predicted alpha/beta hydrolase family esterase
MRQKLLLLHGWGGSDYPHWQSWLAGEIARDYGTLSFPLLENPHYPYKKQWMQQVRQILQSFAPDTVICHSLACTLWFHLCNEGKIAPVKRLLLVSPPRLNVELETIKSFFPVSPPEKLYAEEALLVTSTNDPYLDTDEAAALQKALEIPMKIIEEGGHLNVDSHYGAWPWVLKWTLNPGEKLL